MAPSRTSSGSPADLLIKDHKTALARLMQHQSSMHGVRSLPDKKLSKGIDSDGNLPNGAPDDMGSLSAITNIYSASIDKQGKHVWVSECPKDIEAAENDETVKYAVVVRNQKSGDSCRKLEAHSIVVQSPALKQALSVILADYPGVTCELHRLVFDAPFEPFLHRWGAYVAYMNGEDVEEETKAHLKLLFDVLKTELGGKIREYEDYVLNGVTTFDSAWMIFQPGGVIVSEQHRGAYSAFELIETEYVEKDGVECLQLRVDSVDWDGTQFGRLREHVYIARFLGTKAITSLHAFPLEFSKEKDEVESQLIERGKKFEGLAGYNYRAYSGEAITWRDTGEEQPIDVSGRIVIDASSFNRWSGFGRCFLQKFNDNDLEKLAQYNDDDFRKLALVATNGVNGKNEDKAAPVKLSSYHQMLCRPRLRGYSLKLKMWLHFYISNLTDIEWNDKAFESLVLPDDIKELVLAFCESQVLNRDTFDDVIVGKGRGVIILLHGPPGVGKTLTSEAVAEYMRVPLHSTTSGDLGCNPQMIERSLAKALELVSKWNAILLIDECDVFLEARTSHDMTRNQMVSIFLRTLEYYEGILFLTTNRGDNIDAAFDSRIHLSLSYPALTNVSRRQIWTNFLSSSKNESRLSAKDLDELCIIHLNGRQIKNVLKTAQLLSLRKKQNLDRAAIDLVLRIQKQRIKNLDYYL